MALFTRKTAYTASLVGCGRIGFTLGFDKKREQPASHTMALLSNPRVRITAGSDTDAEQLTSWQRYVSKRQHAPAAAFACSADMYAYFREQKTVSDIIVVAVNEDAHKAETLAAIRAKPRLVILEKPVALNSAEAEEIKSAADECGVPVMVNHERRFACDYNAAREYMSRIGDIQSIRAELFSSLRVYSAEEEATGAYSLLHDGTHLVDIVQFLLGEEVHNPVLTGVWKDDKGDVRNVSAHYSTSRCPSVDICMSGRSRFFSFGVDVLGTTGRICIGNGYAKFYQRRESSLYTGFYSLARDRSVRLPRKTGYFANMLQNGIDFLDGRAMLVSPLAVAMADLAVLEEIKAALIQYCPR
ncbi:MAG: Gfo/Idh/MocA family oxidoreductase [Treponema sp.]|nr:Gfo/Idh/MocA family oxidoreductase [Treponema sp.]